jgi:hypothetical protein
LSEEHFEVRKTVNNMIRRGVIAALLAAPAWAAFIPVNGTGTLSHTGGLDFLTVTAEGHRGLDSVIWSIIDQPIIPCPGGCYAVDNVSGSITLHLDGIDYVSDRLSFGASTQYFEGTVSVLDAVGHPLIGVNIDARISVGTPVYTGADYTASVTIMPVPEPGSIALAATGLALCLLHAKRHLRRRADHRISGV